MKDSAEPPEASSMSARAAAAFADHLRRIEAGEARSIEQLCAAHADLADLLRNMYENWRAVARLLDERRDGDERSLLERSTRSAMNLHAADPSQSDSWGALLERLALHAPRESRYQLEGEIGRGGMGQVVEVFDRDLRRRLAMKTIRPRPGDASEPEVADARLTGRFLEEAQVTAQLDHPGIVPVHELGVDAHGRPYFTMKLVKGDDLRTVFGKVRRREAGWNQPRALGVLLRVCEAVAFAHDRHVIHRDLKPANVMVGRFGETYVMDWGLARVATAGGTPRRGEATTSSQRSRSIVRTDRNQARDERPDSPLFTGDGDILGSPPYMPPEQALGGSELLDARADCYAIGAILYELLTGQMPYVPPGRTITGEEVHRCLLAGPPTPVQQLAPRAPAELVAICEKAMARPVEARYQSAIEFAEDLRAYLENRVVKAHRTGPLVELRKWVQRNRAVAASIGLLFIVMLAAAIGMYLVERARVHEVQLAADLALARELDEQVDELGPIDAEHIEQRARWLSRADTLVARGNAWRNELRALRAGAPPLGEADRLAIAARHPRWSELISLRDLADGLSTVTEERRREAGSDSPDARRVALTKLAILERELPFLRMQVDHLQSEILGPIGPDFADPDAHLRHARLADLVTRLECLEETAGGAIARVRAEAAEARSLHARTIEEPAVADAWREAVEAIGDEQRCPHYAGLARPLPPQSGLVPLGQDPESGLHEFWHVLSGTRPQRDALGHYRIEAETGLVLVLVPGGRFCFGAQKTEPKAPGYDPEAADNEATARETTLDPFFLSKYEMTQGQWIRATGTNPSEYFAGGDYGPKGHSLTVSRIHPVERVSWTEAEVALRRWGLALPTEAQFEFALRGGTTTRFWTGDEPSSLLGKVNQFGADDRWDFHAPVDFGAANPFGFVAINGNVWEWCQDWYIDQLEKGRPTTITGELEGGPMLQRAFRGGSYTSKAASMRAARRRGLSPNDRLNDCGVRPARAVRW